MFRSAKFHTYDNLVGRAKSLNKILYPHGTFLLTSKLDYMAYWLIIYYFHCNTLILFLKMHLLFPLLNNLNVLIYTLNHTKKKQKKKHFVLDDDQDFMSENIDVDMILLDLMSLMGFKSSFLLTSIIAKIIKTLTAPT